MVTGSLVGTKCPHQSRIEGLRDLLDRLRDERLRDLLRAAFLRVSQVAALSAVESEKPVFRLASLERCGK